MAKRYEKEVGISWCLKRIKGRVLDIGFAESSFIVDK